MGVNICKSCCCGDPCQIRELDLQEIRELKNEFYSDADEIISKLGNAKARMIELLGRDIQYFSISEKCKIGLIESEKGHILKVFFMIPKNSEEVSKTLEEVGRKSWDSLIETCNLLEKNENFSVVYLKYKAQLMYSAKEMIIALKKEDFQDGKLVYYTSMPEQTKGNTNIEVFEGGYYVQGTQNSTVTLLVHFFIGGNSLTKLLQNLSEKYASNAFDSIFNLFPE